MSSSGGQDHSILKHLFAACKDDENAYRAAAKYVEPEGLKAVLRDCAEQRARYAADLQSALAALGSHSQSTGTITAALHLGWATIKAAATGGDHLAMLAECARGEEAARGRYEAALKENLADDTRELVVRQLEGIQVGADTLRALQGTAT